MNNGKVNKGHIEDFIKAKGAEMLDLIAETTLNWGKAKECIFPRLINYEWNKETLESAIALRKFGDLAVLFYLRHDDETTSIVKTELIKEMWKKDIDEVMEVAIENMRKANENPIQSFFGMTTITNKEKRYGASALLDWRVRADLEARFGEVWLVPSSIHEWIVFPIADEEEEKEKLNELIKQVNNEQLDIGEWLSDHVYRLTETGDIVSCV